MPLIEKHRRVQAAARLVLARLTETINAKDTERSIAIRAASLMSAHGISQTWYHDCLALVLLGSRSCISVSGREYQPSDEEVGLVNLVTVDLSPSDGGVWGDCARSFFVEGGACVKTPTDPNFIEGARAQRDLHASIQSFVTPKTTFGGLFEFANTRIRSLGFENLDFLGNVGHSIELSLSERLYIEAGNDEPLASVTMFTFEPHIRALGGTWGFKHENIYYFQNDKLQER